MVKITNGVDTFEVTNGAYENNFKKLGYKIVGKKAAKVVEEEPAEVTEATEEAVEEQKDEVTEKPLSQWTKKEVKEYADANDIDLSGTKNVDEAKERISAHLGQ